MAYRRAALLFAIVALLLWAASCKTSEGAKSTEAERQTTASSSQSEGDDSTRAHDKHHAEHKHGSTADEAKGHGRHHDFEHPQKYAEEWNAEERDEWQRPEHVVEILGAESGETVVDLGTGTGYFLPHLSRAVGPDGTVLALDVSKNMLEYVDSKVRPELPHDNLETRQVERDDPGLDDGSVDHILMVNTWHHIEDRVGYAEKMLADLKPGGTFVDVDYTMETDKGPPQKIRLTPEEVVEELESAGFEATVAEESLPNQYVVVGTKPGG